MKLLLHKITSIILGLGLTLGTFAYAQGDIEYFSLNHKDFLIMRDERDSTCGTYLSLPFLLKNTFWDEDHYQLFITLGASPPSIEEYTFLKSHFSLRRLSPISIQNISIHWDEFFLSTSPSKTLRSPLDPLSEMTTIFEFTPFRYAKVKERFQQKISFSLSGQIELAYHGVSTLGESSFEMNRSTLYEMLKTKKVWKKEEALNAINTHTRFSSSGSASSRFASSRFASSTDTPVLQFWLSSLFHFYFASLDESQDLWTLRSLENLPTTSELFQVSSLSDQTLHTRLFFSLF